MPKASKSEAIKLAQLSTDCSFLLSHLIRPDFKTDPRAILTSILGVGVSNSNPTLKASNVGWYSVATEAYTFDYTTKSAGVKGDARAVCFTESTLAGLRAHREVFSLKYGLAFDRDHLYERGANPCLNIRDDLFKKPIIIDKTEWYLYNVLPRELQPYINVINESFDATHEREWRFAGDFSFDYMELRFVFCPEVDFPLFSRIQRNGMPVLFDLAWLDRI